MSLQMQKTGYQKVYTLNMKAGADNGPDTKDTSCGHKSQLLNNHKFEELLNFQNLDFHMLKVFMLQKSVSRRILGTFPPGFHHVFGDSRSRTMVTEDVYISKHESTFFLWISSQIFGQEDMLGSEQSPKHASSFLSK